MALSHTVRFFILAEGIGLMLILVSVEIHTINRTPREQEDSVWVNLTSKDQGYVLIGSPEKYGLLPGVPNGVDGSRNVYGVSWTHQLHCLAMIRDQYHSMQGKHTDNRRDSHGDLHHIEHCFDYLRQNIECVSDMTLEWADKERTKNGDLQINGYGIIHKCRNKVGN
jgi:hypothetical protein